MDEVDERGRVPVACSRLPPIDLRNRLRQLTMIDNGVLDSSREFRCGYSRYRINDHLEPAGNATPYQ